jgi:hypothetical protein
MEIWVTDNSTNTKSLVMENSASTENWVVQDSGRKKPEEVRGAVPSKRPAPWWCPKGYYQDIKMQIAKDAAK